MDLKLKTILATGLLISGISTAQAELIDRGSGLIYDTVLDITWLQDAQYSIASTGVAKRNWVDAMNWADQLEYYDSVRDVTWTNWRLPSTVNDPSSIGWDTTGMSSELAYMYYINLGYEANMSLDPSDPAPTSTNYNPFYNLAYRGYWSSTATGNGDSDIDVWYLHMHFGYQDVNSGLGDEQRMWAVMDGDVAATFVPLPPSMYLMVSGLLGFAAIGSLKKQPRQDQAPV